MRNPIAPKEFRAELFNLFSQKWFLLTAGDFSSGKFNPMTVSWGFLGVVWQRPVAIALVRPQRYTLEFMEQYDTFTLSAFPEKYRDALTLCGTKSGRDMDKIMESGLTPTISEKIAAPSFEEADLVIECKKIYCGAFLPNGFMDNSIPKEMYAADDYHKTFIGEVLHISGTNEYRQ